MGDKIPPIADENGHSTLIRVEQPEEWAMGDKIPPIADENGHSTLIRVERPEEWAMGGTNSPPLWMKHIDQCVSTSDNTIPP